MNRMILAILGISLAGSAHAQSPGEPGRGSHAENSDRRGNSVGRPEEGFYPSLQQWLP